MSAEPWAPRTGYAFTCEPGDGWRNLLSRIYPDWRIESRNLFGHASDFFVATHKGQEVDELLFHLRPDLEVGQQIISPTRIGFCCSHSGNGLDSSRETLPPGITGTIREIGVFLRLSCGRYRPSAHVVVDLDPETVPGRHRYRACLPPAPLRVISDVRREAALYGGLFGLEPAR